MSVPSESAFEKVGFDAMLSSANDLGLDRLLDVNALTANVQSALAAEYLRMLATSMKKRLDSLQPIRKAVNDNAAFIRSKYTELEGQESRKKVRTFWGFQLWLFVCWRDLLNAHEIVLESLVSNGERFPTVKNITYLHCTIS